MSEVKQTRISLKRLKVAAFASEETLCFEATVLLDGLPIAEARNDGHGGMTNLRAIKGAEAKLRSADEFAKSLPPLISEYADPKDATRKLELPMSLEFLVDLLASHEDAEKRLRTAFKRDMAKKVMYVANNRLLYLKGINRIICSTEEIQRFHKRIRAEHGPETTILHELSQDEAFALWRRFAVKEGDTP